MYSWLKPLLFLLPPEKAHHLTVGLLRLPLVNWLIRRWCRLEDPKLERTLWGIRFPNPVGLAAGFDKDGKYFEDMAALGFGFVEIGTVTPKGQDGNPRPRLFRLPADGALINRMGFNNEGVEALAQRLKNRRNKTLIIGGNIGKNKVTPNEQALDDYALCFEALFPLVDYFVVNVSSPNTPGLRELQEKEPLLRLLAHLQTLNQQRAHPKPLLLKIAPDLTDSQLDDVVEIARAVNLSGIIATNTTLSRQGITDEILAKEAGGLSGAPLRNRSTEVIRYIHEKTRGELPIIGVGGINSAGDALEKLKAGASLVQVYTGLIYKGPALIKEIKKGLLA